VGHEHCEACVAVPVGKGIDAAVAASMTPRKPSSQSGQMQNASQAKRSISGLDFIWWCHVGARRSARQVLPILWSKRAVEDLPRA
jgi:hypothetical protein